MPAPDGVPAIRDVGLCAKIVTFADALSEPANRAALAYRAALDAAGWDGVEETSVSLVSAFVRFDPLALAPGELERRLAELAASRDWTRAPLPPGRRLWRVPVALGGEAGPEFEEAAALAGRDPDAARDDILSSRLRVFTIGFAPGQPYLGELPEAWDIPRRATLNPRVPAASLVVAIRQLIVFSGAAPTGWRHVGQTAFRCFRPGTAAPIALAPGDEVAFAEVSPDELAEIRERDEAGGGTGDGGATREAIA